MTQIIEETKTTQVDGPTKVEATTSATSTVTPKADSTQTMERLIYFIFGVLEMLLIFRLILKALGANPASAFVNLIYGITGIFILPFEGIFSRGETTGLETTAVFEPATLVAIVVYALIAWGAVMLVRILAGKKPQA